MARHFSALMALAAALALLAACESGEAPAVDPGAGERPARANETPMTEGPAQDWQRGVVAYCTELIDHFRASADTLNGQVAHFTLAPTEDSRAATLSSWRLSLSAWGAASLCLHSPLPEASPMQHREWHARTAAAPAMAGFLDDVPGFEGSGIVHDETVSLTLENLVRQHQVTDEAEVALGLFALEVLLFGAVPRSPQDYAPAGDLESIPLTEQSHQARRSRITALLALDLAHQARQWQGYWQTLAGSPFAETDAAAVLWQWSRALEHLAPLHSSDDGTGLALMAAHDDLYREALLTALGHWWAEATTLEQIERLGLSVETWRDTGSQLMSADPAAVAQAARQLRDLSRRLEVAGGRTAPAGFTPEHEEEPS